MRRPLRQLSEPWRTADTRVSPTTFLPSKTMGTPRVGGSQAKCSCASGSKPSQSCCGMPSSITPIIGMCSRSTWAKVPSLIRLSRPLSSGSKDPRRSRQRTDVVLWPVSDRATGPDRRSPGTSRGLRLERCRGRASAAHRVNRMGLKTQGFKSPCSLQRPSPRRPRAGHFCRVVPAAVWPPVFARRRRPPSGPRRWQSGGRISCSIHWWTMPAPETGNGQCPSPT